MSYGTDGDSAELASVFGMLLLRGAMGLVVVGVLLKELYEWGIGDPGAFDVRSLAFVVISFIVMLFSMKK
jgi:hypothetical protein